MDLKFINSEHFFILAACIKECDLEDEYEELEKYDFNHFNEISEKIIDKFKSGKNEYFSNEVDHVFFYSYRNEENCVDKLFKSKENIILSDNLDDHLKKIIIKDSDNLIERKTRIYVCLGWEVTKTKLIVREEESYGKIRCFNFLPEADEYLWDFDSFCNLEILRKYPLMGKEYEDWIKENPGKEFREFLKEQKLIMNGEKKRLDDMILSGALAKIDNVMSGIMSMARGGIIKDPSYTYYSDGGSSGNKPKDPAKAVRKLNLADYFQYGMRIADLTDKEREVVNELLKKTFSKSSTNN